MKTTLVLLLATLLSACATVDTAGTKDLSRSATVVGQVDRHGGTFTWRSFIPLSVDSRPVNHSFWGDPQDTVVHVESGVRRITLRAAFNTGFGGGGPWEAIVLLVATVEAGSAYRLNGQVRDNRFIVWLEDANSGARFAEEGSATWAPIAQSQSIPIFIPIRK